MTSYLTGFLVVSHNLFFFSSLYSPGVSLFLVKEVPIKRLLPLARYCLAIRPLLTSSSFPGHLMNPLSFRFTALSKLHLAFFLLE